jgi:drug/metabolite transporter (DMT)-like permease
VLQQRHPEREPYGLVVLGNLMVVAMCLPAALPSLAVTARQALALAFLGVFQIGLSWMLLAAGLKYVSATTGVITRMSEAVFCIAWVAIGIHERPSACSLLGGAVLLGVLVWYNLGGSPGAKAGAREGEGGKGALDAPGPG